MAKDKQEKENVERVVHEVRRTTLLPDVSKDRFVFEKHDDDQWHIHFAAATHYSLEQMKEIVATMETMDKDGKIIKIGAENG